MVSASMIKFLQTLNLTLMILCPLNKPLNLHVLTIIVRSVFEDEGKFYPKFYLGECFYEL